MAQGQTDVRDQRVFRVGLAEQHADAGGFGLLAMPVVGGSDHDHRQLRGPWVGADVARQLEAVHAGHLHIGDEHLGQLHLQLLHGIEPVDGIGYLVVVLRQQPAGLDAHDLGVVGHQHQRLCRGLGGARRHGRGRAFGFEPLFLGTPFGQALRIPLGLFSGTLRGRNAFSLEALGPRTLGGHLLGRKPLCFQALGFDAPDFLALGLGTFGLNTVGPRTLGDRLLGRKALCFQTLGFDAPDFLALGLGTFGLNALGPRTLGDRLLGRKALCFQALGFDAPDFLALGLGTFGPKASGFGLIDRQALRFAFDRFKAGLLLPLISLGARLRRAFGVGARCRQTFLAGAP